MADYVPHFTARLKLRYRVESTNHDLVVRFLRSAPSGVADMVEKLRLFLEALEPQLYDDWTFLGLSVAGQGQTTFVPIATTFSISPAVSSAGREVSALAQQLRFEGVSVDGSRTAIVLFGTNFGPADVGSDFRVTAAEDGQISGAIAALNINTEAEFATASGLLATWRQYANLKYNDHYVRQLRG